MDTPYWDRHGGDGRQLTAAQVRTCAGEGGGERTVAGSLWDEHMPRETGIETVSLPLPVQ